MRTSRKNLHASLAVVAGLAAAGASVGAALPVHAWPTQATVLPELQEVTVRTTARSAATATEPAGSTVTFPFDEPLDEATPLGPADFTLYDGDGTVHQARDVVVAGDTVTAWFPDIDTVKALDRISLGAVAESAVRDLDGGANPLGSSYPSRTLTYQTTGLQGCPALRRVTNVQVLRSTTRADFVFECDKSPDGPPDNTKFNLQLVDGAATSGIDRRRTMRGDLSVVTIWFPGRHPARTIARGTVDEDAVRWDYTVRDPMDEWTELYYYTGIQAGSVSHQGNTTRPDLVGVSLQPNPRPGRPDHAVFVFDQKVTSPRAGRFRLYPDGTGTRAVRLKAGPRRVRVTFPADSLTATRQASVAAGAVRGGRADEVGVTNTLTESSPANGYVAGPSFESWGGFDHASSVPRALFDFDVNLVGEPRPTAFALYTQAGERLGAELCTIEPNPRDYGRMRRVGCTFPGATWEEVDSGAIGPATVEAGAVYDAKGRTNPPGSM